jgi:hypothetical protein
VTALLFGIDVWVDYIKVAMPMQQIVLTHGSGIFPAMMPTAFMNARIVDLPLPWCWAIQCVASVAAIGAVIWTFWTPRDRNLSLALFVTASFLVTPYAFNYDMVVFGWVVTMIRDHETSGIKDHRLALAVWTLPVSTILLGLAHIPMSSVVLMIFAGRLVWRLAHATAPQKSPVPQALPAAA